MGKSTCKGTYLLTILQFLLLLLSKGRLELTVIPHNICSFIGLHN